MYVSKVYVPFLPLSSDALTLEPHSCWIPPVIIALSGLLSLKSVSRWSRSCPWPNSKQTLLNLESRGLRCLSRSVRSISVRAPKWAQPMQISPPWSSFWLQIRDHWLCPECTAVAAIQLRMRMRILTRPENLLAILSHKTSKKKSRIRPCELCC